jgi:hypothetical protein
MALHFVPRTETASQATFSIIGGGMDRPQFQDFFTSRPEGPKA